MALDIPTIPFFPLILSSVSSHSICTYCGLYSTWTVLGIMYSFRHYLDSWIEVSSQPSSSSMSSNNDDIITTGLRVQQREPNYYRYRSHRAVISTQAGHSPRESGSSQDEYEESESEEDRVLSSSNEEMNKQPSANPLLSQNRPAPGAVSSSDEDDNSTALGTQINTSRFVPQPNVFSHPPISRNPSWTRATEQRRSEPSEISNSSHRTVVPRNTQASVRPNRSVRRPEHQQHSPYSMISPSHHADHDAALRASLSTLLSCAAAARGLPKSEPQQSPASPSREQPSSFRLVPESIAVGEGDSEDEGPPAANANVSARPPSRKHPNSSGPSYSAQGTPASKKRRSSSPKDRTSGHPSGFRKSRRTDSLTPSPTVMTWVLSAGVVVLFSAISFSAGYMLGKEVGRMEASSGMGPCDGGLTGGAASEQQAVKGSLKKLRWGSSNAGAGILA